MVPFDCKFDVSIKIKSNSRFEVVGGWETFFKNHTTYHNKFSF